MCHSVGLRTASAIFFLVKLAPGLTRPGPRRSGARNRSLNPRALGRPLHVMLALPGMEKRRWSEHGARPAFSIPGPQANAGHDHPLAFYLAAAKTASVPGEGRAATGPQPRIQSAGYPGPARPFIDAANVGRMVSLPAQRRLAVFLPGERC